MLQKIRDFLIGLPRNPFDPGTRKHIALVAFLAWIGLGADGLSSSAYGPEAAFLALGTHYHLALYLSFLTALTVFIIAIAYNQVIELFPSGGGGYKVATKLIHAKAGLVSGAALIVDYVLTIAISIASGIDAIFSLLPVSAQEHKLHVEIFCIVLLMVLNLRGMKESIKILMPIFLGFVVTHFLIITYGIVAKAPHLPAMFSESVQTTRSVAGQLGWFFVLSLFLRAYSLGGGTYTGLEAVSNNVNHLAEPRVRTGKWTMFYMALSLSLTAGGIIFLYLLWQVKPVFGETLNAVVFGDILHSFAYGHYFLIIVLFLEAALLFVGANTGFLGGPAVLANMSLDGWTPKRFRILSSRLVTQNGIIFFGITALLILLWTRGEVSLLVVLYSMNVFLTFSLSLLGLCIYWFRHRHTEKHWKSRISLSIIGFIVCASILVITLLEKFSAGGWMTVLITSVVIAVCMYIKNHYESVKKQVKALDQILKLPVDHKALTKAPVLNPILPTAVFLVGDSIGEGMHTLLWVQRMFPGHFKNFIFISVGVVDVGSYDSDSALTKMQYNIEEKLEYFVNFSHAHGIAATSFSAYGNDPVKKVVELAEEVQAQYSNAVFFAATLITKQDNWFTRRLHSDTAVTIQRFLHLKGLQMVILPVKLER